LIVVSFKPFPEIILIFFPEKFETPSYRLILARRQTPVLCVCSPRLSFYPVVNGNDTIVNIEKFQFDNSVEKQPIFAVPVGNNLDHLRRPASKYSIRLLSSRCCPELNETSNPIHPQLFD
jgi:hypothetical protein